jgi:hypothetical protein
MKVEDAYRRSMETILNWIQDSINPSKTQVFFRTYAPVHFRFDYSNDFNFPSYLYYSMFDHLNSILSEIPNIHTVSSLKPLDQNKKISDYNLTH